MKKVFSFYKQMRIVVFSIFLLGLGFTAQATHYAAADIHVDYIGSGPSDYTYKITLNIYKACEWGNANLPNITTLNWTSVSGCAIGGSDTMGKPIIDTVDQLCPSFKSQNSCRLQTTIYPGFVRHTFVKVVTLPRGCTDWVFSWRDGNRNGGILNLLNPNSLFIYVDAMINNSKKADVSSPRYTIDPIPYFCLGYETTFPNAPFDPDLDSMVSINSNPRDNAGVPCLYVTPPYSLTNPIASDPAYPYAIDFNTGTASFKPTVAGKFVLAFQTFSYDKVTKELESYTTRDVQVSVIGCTSDKPQTDKNPTNFVGGYFDTVTNLGYACPGQNISFDMGAKTGPSNILFARWDLSSTPGATFTTVGEGTSRVVGRFNWTPQKSDIGTHVVKLRFIDSTCSTVNPLITERIYTFNLTVLPAVDGGKDGIYCIPGGSAWEMQTVIEPGMRYQWSSIFGSSTVPPFMDNDTIARPKVKPGTLTSYLVQGSVYRGPYRCTTRDTVLVRIGTPLISIDAGAEQKICANTSITLKGVVSPASALSFVKWSLGLTLDDSTKLNPFAKPYVSTYYVLYAEDINGCGFKDTTRVVVDGFQPLMSPFSTRDIVCPNGFTQLFSNVSQQPCGVAQSSCADGVPSDKTIGTGSIPSTTATPFFHNTSSGGERMQILYQRDELLSAGINAGFLNSMAFNIPAKNSTDTFYKFTIKMTCTPDATLTGATMDSYPGIAEVLPSQSYYTTTGWNTFTFPNAYYWDGASNLLVEVCWSKVSGTFGGTPDAVFSSNTGFTSVKYIPSYTLPAPAMGEGCSLAAGTPLLASTRPNTRFNVCTSPNLFKYAWTPTTYLNQPDSANTNVEGINSDINYTIKVTSASNPNCFSTGILPIKIDRSNSVTIMPMSPFILCRPGNFDQLSATGNGPKPLRNLSCGTADPLTCSSEESKILSNPSTGSISPEPSSHAFDGSKSTAHTQYLIPRSAMSTSNITSGTIRSIEIDAVAGSSMNFNNLKIGLKCTDLKQFSSAIPVAFETGVVPVYTAAGATIINAGYNKFTFDLPYNWDTTKNLLIDFCYSQSAIGTGPTINNYKTPGFNYMMQSYGNPGDDICSNPSTEVGPTTFELLPSFRINFCAAGDTEFTYSWAPGDYFQDSLIQNPIVYIDNDTKIYVKTKGRNGCLVSDTLNIIVPPNTRSVTDSQVICLNEGVQLRSYNGVSTKWYETTSNAVYDKASSLSCDDCERAIASPKVNTTYYGAVTSADGCTDTFLTYIQVKPLPTITLTNRDTTIKYGQSVTLNVFGGRQYYWTPLAGLTNPNYVSPSASPLVTTTYVVVGVGENGCRGEDSVKITIDYKSKMSVPTAFSPDGDGKNDIFRLVGVTFQSLSEFKVFNRWGQELFSTQNINDGWDGTFNGKPMDIGVYNYIIQVGYPDGSTQTLKGDVTLVR